MNDMLLQAACPVCDAAVAATDSIVVSELLTCPDCGVELEVAGISPLTLIEAPCEEEDWGE